MHMALGLPTQREGMKPFERQGKPSERNQFVNPLLSDIKQMQFDIGVWAVLPFMEIHHSRNSQPHSHLSTME
ncbi:hypothetical protein [Segatella baroniae]|uniref:hypothetical protein n=1 Tax=Segatella baroniae TaxID=305719 RepID=UPI00137872A3|nr:hypothetical protein [Segatella baroniae]